MRCMRCMGRKRCSGFKRVYEVAALVKAFNDAGFGVKVAGK